jgi:pimeloyl-ACP methyl ester carboxylesterase
MLHGAGQSAGLWHMQTTRLASTARAVALDLPGHGVHAATKGETTIAAYAKWVMDTLADSSPGQVVLCGHSMGGAIVQHLLLHYPRFFKAGVLVNTGARLRVHHKLLEIMGQGYTAFVDFVYEQGVAAANQIPVLHARFHEISACLPDVALGDYLACDAFDVMNRVDRIQVPVLVVGSEQDRLTPLKYSTYLAETIPGARLSIIPLTGHYSPLENSMLLNQMLVEFLESLREDM